MSESRQGNVPAFRFDRSIDDLIPDDVTLSVYRPAGDGLALYVTPVEFPADEFRIFLEPRDMLRLAWHLVVGAIRWRNNRPWDADFTPEERAQMEADHARILTRFSTISRARRRVCAASDSWPRSATSRRSSPRTG